MNDSAIIPVHLPQGNGLVDFFGFISQPHGKFFQIQSSGCQIAFNIHLDPDPVMTVVALVDDFVYQRLDGFKRLALLSDKRPGIATGDIQQDTVAGFFSRYGCIGGNRIDDTLQYIPCEVYRIFPGPG